MSLDSSQEGHEWLLRYADNAKVASAALRLIWHDLHISETGQSGRLDRVHAQALECWPAAVKEAERERQAVRDQVSSPKQLLAADASWKAIETRKLSQPLLLDSVCRFRV